MERMTLGGVLLLTFKRSSHQRFHFFYSESCFSLSDNDLWCANVIQEVCNNVMVTFWSYFKFLITIQVCENSLNAILKDSCLPSAFQNII